MYGERFHKARFAKILLKFIDRWEYRLSETEWLDEMATDALREAVRRVVASRSSCSTNLYWQGKCHRVWLKYVNEEYVECRYAQVELFERGRGSSLYRPRRTEVAK